MGNFLIWLACFLGIPVLVYLSMRKDFDFDRKFAIQGIITWSIVGVVSFLAEVVYPESRKIIEFSVLMVGLALSFLWIIVRATWKKVSRKNKP